MYEGGVRLLELTFDAAGHTTDEEFRMLAAMDGEAITALAKKYVAVIKNASCG